MKKARCKFLCQSVTDHGYGHREVTFSASYDPDLTEDQSFSKATPSGTLVISVTNPAAFEMFQPQKYYYLDITAVEAE